MTGMDMFASPPIVLAEQVFLLKQYVDTTTLLPSIQAVAQQAGFRHMTVPGGQIMKVALTNCGKLGWTSDSSGYRYSLLDPSSGKAWPAMPEPFFDLGTRAAAQCGFENFAPEACLVNRYVSGAGVGLHQDRNEKDFSQPIVSLSIGLLRSDATRSFTLSDGDVIVWGGVSRLVFHGVRPLSVGRGIRHNITLRKAC
jgi:DNA oxidative demethylase